MPSTLARLHALMSVGAAVAVLRTAGHVLETPRISLRLADPVRSSRPLSKDPFSNCRQCATGPAGFGS